MTTAATPLTISVTPTRPRTTPPPAERRFGAHLARAAEEVGQVAARLAGVPELAAVRVATAPTGAPSPPIAPGSAVASPGSAADPSSGAWPPVDALSTADRSLYYLQLQERVSAEHRHYTTLSNVMKARHDAAKVAINNIG